MPAPLAADLRNEAKALILSGVSQAETARRLQISTRTLNAWVLRYEWKSQADAVKVQVAKVVQMTAVDKITDREARARDVLTRIHLRQAERLEKGDIDGLAGSREGEAGVLSRLTDTAAVLYGWGKQQGGKNLVITIDPTTMVDAVEVPSTPAIEVPTEDK